MKLLGQAHLTIRTTVVSTFILVTALTAALAIGLQYYFGHSLAKVAARDLYTGASSAIASQLRHISESTTNVIELLADNPVLADPSMTTEQRNVFTKVMLQNPMFYGVYLGQNNGSFYEIINLNASEKARKSLRALPSDRWLIVTVNGGESAEQLRQFQYVDENFNVRVTRTENTTYDVLSRPWYLSAMASPAVQRTDPYLFSQLQAPGQTVSKRLPGTYTVLGIDMTLATVSSFLRQQEFSQDSDVFVYKDDGQVVASSLDNTDNSLQLPIPTLNLTPEEKLFIESQAKLNVSNELNWPPFDYALAGQPRGYSVDIMRLIAAMTGLEIQFVNGFSWAELVTEFKDGEIDLLHSVILTDDNAQWGSASDSYISLPYAVLTAGASPAVSSLAELAGKSVAIPAGWSIIPIVQQRFPDIQVVEVESTLEAIERVMDGSVNAALDNEIILRYVSRHYFLSGLQFHSNIDFGDGKVPDKLHIMVQGDSPLMLSIVNKAIAAIGREQRDYLTNAWLDLSLDSGDATTGAVPHDALVKLASSPMRQEQLTEIQHKGQAYFAYVTALSTGDENPSYFGILVPRESVTGNFMAKVQLSAMITTGFLLLLLPLTWFFASPIVNPIKLLAAETDKIRRREYDQVVHVQAHVKELDDLSDSMVTMVAAIQAHEQAQRDLMDSFIQLIAQAIDDKSAYTGGHCARVPELALMLAEHASNSEQEAFKDFKFETEDEWREYRIGAWLHDCGKITTPEHVVDKGSKLETIYNRIHEVRMRFEVLRRDAELNYWQQLQQYPENEALFAEELEKSRQRLDDDFGFVAMCNVGGEFLDPEKQDRLIQISQTTWQRHFDDRAGLSPFEELHIPPRDETLPVTEQLLSDKKEHIIKRTRSTDYPPSLGINMDIPEHLYNLGEIYNLSISRGTLTTEDRFKINEHMISTIKMLEALPFPKELQNVPRYASTHHETMKGTGYPRKLPGEELSIPERILAVADVFEALTASDRPYKKAKPVSVAIDILHKMALDNHLDMDCFNLFIEKKVYLQYAEEFLPPEQIDEVDAQKYGAA